MKLLGFFVLLLALLISVSFSSHQQALASSTAAGVGPNCRYGVADDGQSQYFSELGVGWSVNYNFSLKTYPDSNTAYVPTIRVSQVRNANNERTSSYILHNMGPVNPDDVSAVGQRVDSMPRGSLYLIGNEPESILQDDIEPYVYARFYHDTYREIKSHDSTALVAIGGVIFPSEARLRYLDMVWNQYQIAYGEEIPVDVWNIHLYMLPERNWSGEGSSANIAVGTPPSLALYDSSAVFNLGASCNDANVLCNKDHDNVDLFADYLRAFRVWMKDKGQQNKPLIITEVSILWPYIDEGNGECFLRDEDGYCFTPERVSEYMKEIYEHMDSVSDPSLGYPDDNYRLVQQWMWYTSWRSSETLVGAASRLVKLDTTGLSLMGETHRDWVAGRPLNSNIILSSNTASSAVAKSGNLSDPATATLSVRVMNNGNGLNASNQTVTFRDSNNNVIATGTIPAETLRGCTTSHYTVEADWPNVPTGFYKYTVTAPGSGGTITQATGAVLVNPSHQVYLPTISR